MDEDFNSAKGQEAVTFQFTTNTTYSSHQHVFHFISDIFEVILWGYTMLREEDRYEYTKMWSENDGERGFEDLHRKLTLKNFCSPLMKLIHCLIHLDLEPEI
jgi:hypothetical protein